MQLNGIEHMTITKVAAIALVATAAAWSSAALAQSLPGSVELAPGVWTTPEITAKCQAYVAKRVPVGGDQQRQSMMASCVKKAYAKASSKKKRG
jgi:hypothetical protein